MNHQLNADVHIHPGREDKARKTRRGSWSKLWQKHTCTMHGKHIVKYHECVDMRKHRIEDSRWFNYVNLGNGWGGQRSAMLWRNNPIHKSAGTSGCHFASVLKREKKLFEGLWKFKWELQTVQRKCSKTRQMTDFSCDLLVFKVATSSSSAVLPCSTGAKLENAWLNQWKSHWCKEVLLERVTRSRLCLWLGYC